MSNVEIQKTAKPMLVILNEARSDQTKSKEIKQWVNLKGKIFRFT